MGVLGVVAITAGGAAFNFIKTHPLFSAFVGGSAMGGALMFGKNYIISGLTHFAQDPNVIPGQVTLTLLDGTQVHLNVDELGIRKADDPAFVPKMVIAGVAGVLCSYILPK